MKFIIIFSILTCFLFSCVEYTTENQKKIQYKEDKVIQEFTKIDGKTVRYFKGKSSCIGCSTLLQSLLLKGDTSGVFRLKENYIGRPEDGDAEIITTGIWKEEIINKQKYIRIGKGSFSDSTHQNVYLIIKDGLLPKIIDGDSVEKPELYKLTLSVKKD